MHGFTDCWQGKGEEQRPTVDLNRPHGMLEFRLGRAVAVTPLVREHLDGVAKAQSEGNRATTTSTASDPVGSCGSGGGCAQGVGRHMEQAAGCCRQRGCVGSSSGATGEGHRSRVDPARDTQRQRPRRHRVTRLVGRLDSDGNLRQIFTARWSELCGSLAGAGPPQHGLSSNKMALITSHCGTMRSPSVEAWRRHAGRVCGGVLPACRKWTRTN